MFVNGYWLGMHPEPEDLMLKLRELRQKPEIPSEISLYRDIREREIYIFTDAGRVCRPLLVVQDNKLKLRRRHVDMLREVSNEVVCCFAIIRCHLHDIVLQGGVSPWKHLLVKGVVEYIDCYEEETSMIAMTPDKLLNSYSSSYTHCEIHPAMILGVCASIIPFPDHNQASHTQ